MKAARLEESIGQVGMQLHRSIKSIFDPKGLFNPGSMFHYEPEAAHAATNLSSALQPR